MLLSRQALFDRYWKRLLSTPGSCHGQGACWPQSRHDCDPCCIEAAACLEASRSNSVVDCCLQVVAMLTQTEVDPHDPAFNEPTKFIGPCYTKSEAEK